MAGPDDLSIFSWLFKSADGLLNNYATEASQRVIATIAPVAVTLFGIFVLLWGFAHLRNKIEEPVTDGAMRLVKVAIVLGIALNVTYYGNFVVDFALNTPMAFAQSASGSSAGTTSASVGDVLDKSLNKGFQLGQRVWDQGGITSPGPVVCAIVIWVSVALILLFSAMLIMLSKVALVVLLAIGPVFIMLLLFQGTQRFFEVWMGQVVNFMVTMVLAVLVTVLLITLVDGFLQRMLSDTTASSGKMLLETVVMGGIGVLVLRQVPAMASAIAGGIAVSTMGAFGASMSGVKGVGDKATGKSIRDAAKHQRTKATASKYNDMRGRAAARVGNAFRRKNTITS